MISEQLITVLTASTGLRAELLDATVRLLHSRDVAGLTTREIARLPLGRLDRGPLPKATDPRRGYSSTGHRKTTLSRKEEFPVDSHEGTGQTQSRCQRRSRAALDGDLAMRRVGSTL